LKPQLEVRKTALQRFEDSRHAQSSAPTGFAYFQLRIYSPDEAHQECNIAYSFSW
jgi:hypothetical protein